jgi:hypothetical protein
MGINELPEADMHWSADPLIGNSAVQLDMTCNQYQKITQYFHASDQAAEPRRVHQGYDKLYKVPDVITAVSEAFHHGYTLLRLIAVDEAMIKFTGRLVVLVTKTTAQSIALVTT